MSKLKVIQSQSEVEELIHYCKQTKQASIDFETTSFNYYAPNEFPLILGVSFQPGSSWILPMGHKDSPFKKNYHKMFALFAREVLEDWDIVKVAWNLKFEYKWCMRLGCFMKGRLFDGMLAKYCLDEERPHDLKDFVSVMFPQYAGFEDAIDKRIPWRDKDFYKLCTYCGIDADLTNRGMIYMEGKLIKLGFYNLFRNLLMTATRVLAESEFRGMIVDRSYLEGLMKIYQTKIADSEYKLYHNKQILKYDRNYRKYHLKQLIKKVKLEIAAIREEDAPNAARLIANRENKITGFLNGQFGKKDAYDKINFKSPRQLDQFLFTSNFGLGLKPPKQTDSGGNSTDEETLLKLKDHDKTGFMDELLNHRGLVKLDSTYISGIYPMLDGFDRVHCGYKIHGTVTGRLSCGDPNFQNIPRNTTASDIKKMFIPPPGYLLLEVDYSQAELRIVAELSRDKAMIDIFKRGYNIHVATACLINGKMDRYDKIKAIIKEADKLSGEELAKPENKKLLFWTKQKKRAKTLNFAILYGQEKEKMAIELKCTPEEAVQFKEDWFNAYPGVKRWIKEQKRHVHKYKCVYSLFGRKRRLYNIDSPKYWMMLEAERQAVNTPIQGASSDFGLFSEVIIREKVLTGELPIDLQQCYTVHDSIGFWIRPYDIHSVVPKLVEICNNPQTEKYFGFRMKKVAMKVSPEVGLTWEGITEYNPKEDYTKWLN